MLGLRVLLLVLREAVASDQGGFGRKMFGF
jgi:hypothetical protein